MSLIPRNNNSQTQFTPFSQDFWDQFFSHDHHPLFPFQPFSNFPFLSRPGPARTVPYSELAVETTGNTRARLECKELPEAHLIVAELPGVEKHEVDVEAEEGGVVVISGGGGGGGEGRFSWRMKLNEEDVMVGLMSWSMENGVLTVVVPKFAGDNNVWLGGESDNGNNVRVVEITGSDE